jgi:hypothetical protein
VLIRRYFILLLWVFLGVGIVSDIFMAAIEAITSVSKWVETKDSDGRTQQVTYNVERFAFLQPRRISRVRLHRLGRSTEMERDRCQSDPHGVGLLGPRDPFVLHRDVLA